VLEKSEYLGQLSGLQLEWVRVILVCYVQAGKRGTENEDCFRHLVAIPSSWKLSVRGLKGTMKR
jgi:hypothetical protein